MSYFTTVDFSAMRYADMCEACKGFRKVHHRAMYVSDKDLKEALLRFSPQMLEIDEDDEQEKGFAYAAGVAMARYRRNRK
nr:MAG TPA: hypothetical protein [Caudoviricetes sp.]